MLFALYEITTMMIMTASYTYVSTVISNMNMSGYSYVIQCLIYICLPYGFGLYWYMHNILLAIFLKDVQLCMHMTPII